MPQKPFTNTTLMVDNQRYRSFSQGKYYKCDLNDIIDSKSDQSQVSDVLLLQYSRDIQQITVRFNSQNYFTTKYQFQRSVNPHKES
jgi:hypothetical protein